MKFAQPIITIIHHMLLSIHVLPIVQHDNVWNLTDILSFMLRSYRFFWLRFCGERDLVFCCLFGSLIQNLDWRLVAKKSSNGKTFYSFERDFLYLSKCKARPRFPWSNFLSLCKLKHSSSCLSMPFSIMIDIFKDKMRVLPLSEFKWWVMVVDEDGDLRVIRLG